MPVNDRPLCAFAAENRGDTQINLNRSLNSNELRSLVLKVDTAGEVEAEKNQIFSVFVSPPWNLAAAHSSFHLFFPPVFVPAEPPEDRHVFAVRIGLLDKPGIAVHEGVPCRVVSVHCSPEFKKRTGCMGQCLSPTYHLFDYLLGVYRVLRHGDQHSPAGARLPCSGGYLLVT